MNLLGVAELLLRLFLSELYQCFLMAKTKILIPIGSLYPSQQGGPSNTMYWIAKALDKRKFDVTCITTDTQINEKLKSDTWIEEVGLRRIYLSEKSLFLAPSLIKATFAKIDYNDVIHLNSLFYFPMLFIAFYAKLKGKPIIWSVRGVLHPAAMKQRFFMKHLFLKLIKIFGKKITFHVTGFEEASFVKKYFGLRFPVEDITNFMKLPVFENGKQTKVLLFIGRIHPIKGIDFLIKALPHSNEFMKSDFTLKIAGDYRNEYGDKLISLVEELRLTKKVNFIGQITGRAKEMLYNSSYFTIMPSHSENFGAVVVESMAQGTPVIASSFTPWSVLPKYNIGYHSAIHPLVLAKTIDKALSLSRAEYAKMRQECKNYVYQNFDIIENIEIWQQLYLKSVNAK